VIVIVAGVRVVVFVDSLSPVFVGSYSLVVVVSSSWSWSAMVMPARAKAAEMANGTSLSDTMVVKAKDE